MHWYDNIITEVIIYILQAKLVKKEKLDYKNLREDFKIPHRAEQHLDA